MYVTYVTVVSWKAGHTTKVTLESTGRHSSCVDSLTDRFHSYSWSSFCIFYSWLNWSFLLDSVGIHHFSILDTMSNNNNQNTYPRHPPPPPPPHRYPMIPMPPRGHPGMHPMHAMKYPPHPGMMMHMGMPLPPPPLPHHQKPKKTSTKSTPNNKGMLIPNGIGQVRPPYVKKSTGIKWTAEEVRFRISAICFQSCQLVPGLTVFCFSIWHHAGRCTSCGSGREWSQELETDCQTPS